MIQHYFSETSGEHFGVALVNELPFNVSGKFDQLVMGYRALSASGN
jgi:hypothetical protein